jgi:hypothetical protein
VQPPQPEVSVSPQVAQPTSPPVLLDSSLTYVPSPFIYTPIREWCAPCRGAAIPGCAQTFSAIRYNFQISAYSTDTK